MKLSKALLGAILLGITLQTSGCADDDDSPKPESEQEAEGGDLAGCPACGMG